MNEISSLKGEANLPILHFLLNMKSTIIFFLVFAVAATQVSCGRIYGAKEDAIVEINDRFNDIKKLYDNTVNDIVSEKAKVKPEDMNKFKRDGENIMKLSNQALLKDVNAVMRTAIARGKPMSAIDCIVRTNYEGESMIKGSFDSYTEDLKDVMENKNKLLIVFKFEAELIFKALTDLKNQSIANIKDCNSDKEVGPLKTDALKKHENSKKLLSDIENRITKPNLDEEYKNTRKAYNKQLEDMNATLLRRLQKCIA